MPNYFGINPCINVQVMAQTNPKIKTFGLFILPVKDLLLEYNSILGIVSKSECIYSSSPRS